MSDVIELKPNDEMALVLEQVGNLSQDQIRAFIAEAEERMKDGTPIEIPLEHIFSKNVYVRKITIPQTVLIAGKIHKHQNMTIITQGEASVLSIDGYKRVKAGDMFVSSPGVKRLIYSHAETVWTTVHGTSETNIEKLEKELVTDNYADVLDHEEKKELTMEVKLCHL